MPQIAPIHAIRFATEDGDISTKIAPPYDVLDEGPKQELLGRDPHNVVAIDLPVTPPKTVGPDSAYEQAGQTMQQWLSEGVLKQDEHPAIYAYEQVYTVDDQRFARRGLFAGVGVEPFNRKGGGIHRHELTIKSGTDDRYKLMEATGAQLSPVFGVFPDPENNVTDMLKPYFDAEPDFRGRTDDGVLHRCWRVDNPTMLSALQAFFEPTDVFIADGHHRYTTALNYREAHPEDANAKNCLMVLVAVEDPGMIVLPTHRVLCELSDFSMGKLLELLEEHEAFSVTEAETEDAEALAGQLPDAGPHAMGLFDPQTGKLYLLTATSDDPLAEATPDRPEVWRKLDVAVLHELLIDRVIKPAFGGGGDVKFKYTPDLATMRDWSTAEPGRLGIIVQPTPLRSVCDVSLADDVMPPKSTYFYPKLATGLVINPLR